MNQKPYVLSVSALIWNDSGELLLLQRSENSKNFAGAWEPPGGKSIKGEEVGETALREVREESGLEIKLSSVAGVTEFELPHLRVAILYFHAHTVGGTPRISSEHRHLRWISPVGVKELNLTPPFGRFANSFGLRSP